MVAPAHRQQLPGPATVSLDGMDVTVMCPTSRARILPPGKVRKYFFGRDIKSDNDLLFILLQGKFKILNVARGFCYLPAYSLITVVGCLCTR